MCSIDNLNIIREVVAERVGNNEMFTAYDLSVQTQQTAKERGVPIERHAHMKEAIHAELTQHLSSGQYARTLRSVGAPDPAFVYYPVGGDPNLYQPMPRTGNPNPVLANAGSGVTPGDKPVTSAGPSAADGGSGVTAGGGGSGLGDGTAPQPVPSQSGGRNRIGQTGQASAPTPHDAKPADHGQPAGGGRLPDARATLTVPNALMRQLGFNAREVAYLYACTGSDSVTPVLAVTKSPPPHATIAATYTVDDNHNIRVTASTLSNALQVGQGVTYDFEVVGSEIHIRNYVPPTTP